MSAQEATPDIREGQGIVRSGRWRHSGFHMDWRSASRADRVCDCGEGDQCPNERKPIFFMRRSCANAFSRFDTVTGRLAVRAKAPPRSAAAAGQSCRMSASADHPGHPERTPNFSVDPELT